MIHHGHVFWMGLVGRNLSQFNYLPNYLTLLICHIILLLDRDVPTEL